jgi:hypothetical protein
MPKSVPPSEITVAGRPFSTNAVPDPFDARDLAYRPRLEPLPGSIDRPTASLRHILTQKGDSCTGHALATTINAALAKRAEQEGGRPVKVSPYMLYHFAMRYDDFPGEADTGSSLRAALRGWFYHGVCTESWWPEGPDEEPPDIHDPKFVLHCQERPLGAFYRVNCCRLDDMQSAISELHAVVASAQIHEGWYRPEPVTKNGRTLHVIRRRASPDEVNGHAFALVGYNEIGFLVQNSWGRAWGDEGFAVLTYEDWLDSAYDAWVVRHGVPHTPFVTGRRRDEEATNSILATGVGPNHRRLDRHLVRLAGDGQLSSTGEFISTPKQLDRIISRMKDWHDAWSQQRPADGAAAPATKVRRHVLLYAQGGLLPESASLESAERPLNWWLNNRVYPICLAWESGPAETLLDELGYRMSRSLPKGGIGFDLVEQFDRLVELTARRHRRWMWDQLKQNARAAGGGSTGSTGGAIQLAKRLADYVRQHPRECAVHLVGHGAGAIVLAELLPRLLRLKLPVASLVLLAPAIRVDDFETQLLKPLPAGSIRQFTVFGLSAQRELDDTCIGGGAAFYQKSLLYLISRGLEARVTGTAAAAEVPLLGMAKYFERRDLQARIRRKFPGATFIAAPTSAQPDARTDAARHGDFEDDAFTMTSVAMRLLQTSEVDPFRARTPLLGFDHVPGQHTSTSASVNIADTQPPDAPPVVTTAEGQLFVPQVPSQPGRGDPPELGEAPPDGDRTAMTLRLAGWKPVPAARPTRPTRRRTHA